MQSNLARKSGLGLAAIVLAATLWAIAAIVARQLFESGVTPFELTTARTVIAAVGLAVMQRSWPTLQRWDGRILGLGLSLALVTVTYYIAISRLAVAVALVIQYTAPALVVLFTAVRLRRWPSGITIAIVVAAMLGVALVSGLGASQIRLDGLGLLAALCSAICFTSYTLLSESMVDTYGVTQVMLGGFTVSSCLWILFQITQGFPVAVFVPANIPSILYVGIGGTLMPFSLLCWGIQQVQAERAAIAATLEPVVAAVLAWLLLGQTLNWSQITGGILVLAAVVGLQWRSASQSQK